MTLLVKNSRLGGFLIIFLTFMFLLSSCNSQNNTTTKVTVHKHEKNIINPPTVTIPREPSTTIPPAPLSIQSTYQKGVSLLLYGNYPNIEEISSNLFTQLKGIGVNSISLNFPFYMSNLYSSSVYTTNQTPTDSEITSVILEAHKFGFITNIRPILDGTNLVGGWRGVIAPESISSWFASYTSMIDNYAVLSQKIGVNILTIGVELTSMETYTQYWDTLISQVRDVFKGSITYSSNWTPQLISNRVQFWNKLNFISTDIFVPVQGPSLENMIIQFKNYLSTLNTAYSEYKIPIIVSELGTTSQVGSYTEPWIWNVGTPYSASAQANYYEAAFVALSSYSFVRGIYIWDVPFDQLLGNYNPKTDIGYNPLGKEAETVMQQNFAKL